MTYIIFSLEHTNRKDKFFTLWRPDNAGYTYMLDSAGRYTDIEIGYHHRSDGGSVAVPYDKIPAEFVQLDDKSRPCIKVSFKSVAFVKSYIDKTFSIIFEELKSIGTKPLKP